MHDFEKFYRIDPDSMFDMPWIYFRGRLTAITGDNSAWLAVRRNRDKQWNDLDMSGASETAKNAAKKVKRAKDSNELQQQMSHVARTLIAYSG